jgi:histone H3/H4
MTDQERQRTITVTNHAAVKRFILDAIRKNRPGLRIDRVAGEAFDFYDASVESLIRSVAADLARRADLPDFPPKERLLAWSAVRDRLIALWRGRLTWIRIAGIDDRILRHMEDRLRAKIRGDVHGHPSVGKTFKP